jgi:uncharacterized membrane protein YdbT with pleckstrin-like domain
MSFGAVAQEIAAVTPWALVALILLVVLVVIAGGVAVLAVALRGTPADSRPVVIRAAGDYFRALADFVRALLGRRK